VLTGGWTTPKATTATTATRAIAKQTEEKWHWLPGGYWERELRGQQTSRKDKLHNQNKSSSKELAFRLGKLLADDSNGDDDVAIDATFPLTQKTEEGKLFGLASQEFTFLIYSQKHTHRHTITLTQKYTHTHTLTHIHSRNFAHINWEIRSAAKGSKEITTPTAYAHRTPKLAPGMKNNFQFLVVSNA